jgi:dCTP diphosphatase
MVLSLLTASRTVRKPLLTLLRHSRPRLSQHTESRVNKAKALAFAAKAAVVDKPFTARPITYLGKSNTFHSVEAIFDKNSSDSKESSSLPIKYRNGVAYLSSPYFDPNPLIKEARHAIVNRVAFKLMSQGIMVYSPLTHNLPIDRLGIHGNWVTWKKFDHEMLSRCNRLIVLKLKGWENSKGVAAEIACAEKLKMPIERMEIDQDKYKCTLATASASYTEILERLNTLNSERNWDQFHSPKNLAMNLGVETGELMEHFRWMTDSQSFAPSPQQLSKIRDEIGDVFLVLLNLASVLGIELNQAALDKLVEISKKYPIEKSKGRSDKYTDLK